MKVGNHNLTQKLKSQNKGSPALPVKCSEVELNTEFIQHEFFNVRQEVNELKELNQEISAQLAELQTVNNEQVGLVKNIEIKVNSQVDSIQTITEKHLTSQNKESITKLEVSTKKDERDLVLIGDSIV